MRRRSVGFTLIELLVVVAIIAVLIAILLPSLGRAKANAVRVRCASVLKAWGAVITMYAQENNDQFGVEWEYVYPNPGGTKHKQVWATLSVGGDPQMYDPEWATYASQGKLMSQEYRTCPGDPLFGAAKAAGGSVGQVVGNSNVGARPPIDYSMVRYLPVLSNGSLIYKMTKCSHPSSTMLMSDSTPAVTTLYNYVSTMADFNPAGAESLSDSLNKRHLGTGNVMFLDNHVEQHTYGDFAANIPSKTVSGSSSAYGTAAFVPPPTERGKIWTTYNLDELP